MTTQEQNKMISLFMGKPEHLMPELMKYHTSWDWLQPVVEKIESDISNEVANEYFWNREGAHDHNDFRIFRVSSITDLHEQVAEFLQWYNQSTSKIVSDE